MMQRLIVKLILIIAVIFVFVSCSSDSTPVALAPTQTQPPAPTPTATATQTATPLPPFAPVIPSPSPSPTPDCGSPTPSVTPSPEPSQTMFTVLDYQFFPPDPRRIFDDDFQAFYDDFVTAVQNRDLEFIDSILDDMILFSFADYVGKEDFYAHWESRYERFGRGIWEELDNVIALGGVFFQESRQYENSPREFITPYTYFVPHYGYNAFSIYVVIDSGVNIYAEENIEADIIGTLDYYLLEFNRDFDGYLDFFDKSDDDLVCLTMLSGEIGYIQVRYIRSALDYRFTFRQNENGEWKMVFYESGD